MGGGPSTARKETALTGGVRSCWGVHPVGRSAPDGGGRETSAPGCPGLLLLCAGDVCVRYGVKDPPRLVGPKDKSLLSAKWHLGLQQVHVG